MGLGPAHQVRGDRGLEALAEVEGQLIGAEKMDDTAILATASSIEERTREISNLLK